MFEKRFCPYCGAPLSDGCDCERELAEYEAGLIDELEERQLANAWQQDLIDLVSSRTIAETPIRASAGTAPPALKMVGQRR